MKLYFKVLSIVLFIFFLILSCDNIDKKRKAEPKSVEPTVSIDLPGSINLDSLLEGYVISKAMPNPLPKEEIHRKYTFLYATISRKKINNLDELMKVHHDTFVPINDSVIPIYGIRSREKGNLLFQGFVVDQFFYLKSQDSMRIISQERKIEHPINFY